MTFMITMDKKYVGFYFFRGFTKRLCLGWIAFTFIPMNIEVTLDAGEAELIKNTTTPLTIEATSPIMESK